MMGWYFKKWGVGQLYSSNSFYKKYSAIFSVKNDPLFLCAFERKIMLISFSGILRMLVRKPILYPSWHKTQLQCIFILFTPKP
jgi:hypothetical protein